MTPPHHNAAPECRDNTGLSRRALLKHSLGALAFAAGTAMLHGCSHESPLRVVTNIWPGYKFMYLAEKLGFTSKEQILLQAMPSATACLQSLATGNAEVAGLTLDEVLSARADNMPLVVVAVIDVSMGGDVLLARPDITSLADLRGKRIGVEQSAVGAVMLDAVMQAGQLGYQDIRIVYATADEHLALYRNAQVDALVTFQPFPGKLAPGEAVQLFDSSRIPGRILDVIAARPEAVRNSPNTLRALVEGHFRALQAWRAAPARYSPLLAPLLGIATEDVAQAFQGLEFPDFDANREWLAGQPSRLQQTAETLQNVMLHASLLNHPTRLDSLTDGAFLQ